MLVLIVVIAVDGAILFFVGRYARGKLKERDEAKEPGVAADEQEDTSRE